MLLENKNAVIYETAGAVGSAVARAFAREGARLFLTGRNLGVIDTPAKEIAAAGSTASRIQLMQTTPTTDPVTPAGHLSDKAAAMSDTRGDPRCVQRTVTTGDGVRLAVRDYGAAAAPHTVVLLHGFCLNQVSWAGQVAHLLRRWGQSVRVITYDHRGHGRSGGAPMATYRIEQLGADLARVLAELEVSGPLTLVGHSMGGMAALAYLALPVRNRIDPDGLVLVATAAGRLAERGLGRLLATPATRVLVELIDHAPDVAIRMLTRPACGALARYPGCGQTERTTLAQVATAALASTPLRTAVGFLPALRAYDQSPTLRAITARTFVVSGGADLLTPEAHARDLLAGIPAATHVHLPAAGHMLPREAPRVISAVIDRTMMGLRSPATPQVLAA